jgi:hypothetical protein
LSNRTTVGFHLGPKSKRYSKGILAGWAKQRQSSQLLRHGAVLYPVHGAHPGALALYLA